MTSTVRETYYDAMRPVTVKNTSGEVIPPHAIMRIAGIETRDGNFVIQVAKPNTVFQRRYIVNGPSAIPIGAYGSGNDGQYADVEVNYSASAQAYGASPGSWKAEPDRLCFRMIGTISASGKARMVHEPPAILKVRTSQPIAYGSSGYAAICLDQATIGPWNDITIHNDYVVNGNIGDNVFVIVGWFEDEQKWRVITSVTDLCTAIQGVTGYVGSGTKVLTDACTFVTPGAVSICEDLQSFTEKTDIATDDYVYMVTVVSEPGATTEDPRVVGCYLVTPCEWAKNVPNVTGLDPDEDVHIIVTQAGTDKCGKMTWCDLLQRLQDYTTETDDVVKFVSLVEQYTGATLDDTVCKTVGWCEVVNTMEAIVPIDHDTYKVLIERKQHSSGGAPIGDPECGKIDLCDLLKTFEGGDDADELYFTNRCRFIAAGGGSVTICSAIGGLDVYDALNDWVDGDEVTIPVRVTPLVGAASCYQMTLCDLVRFLMINYTSTLDPTKSYVMVMKPTGEDDGAGGPVLASWDCEFVQIATPCDCTNEPCDPPA